MNIKPWPIKCCVITLLAIPATIFMIGILDPYFQEQKDMNSLAQELIIDPEILIIADYIKLRNSRSPKEMARLIAGAIMEEAKFFNVSSTLILAIIEKETLFECTAVSSVGAKGLMQVYKGQDQHGEEVVIDSEKAFDIHYNIEIGIKILKGKLKSNNGNLTKALDNYSNNTPGYSSGVLENIGRYIMYKEKIENSKSDISIVRNNL